MIIKRFSFAKIAKNDIETPILLKCGKDVKIEGSSEIILEKEINRELLHPPSLGQREVEIDENFYLIPNINDLLRNTRELVDYTIKIRKKYGYNAIFYAPGAPTNLYPVLFYLGYDVFDDCMEKLNCYQLWGLSENCTPGISENIFNMTLAAFKENRLREFVEGIPDNKSQEIIRYLDLNYYEEQEKFYPSYIPSLNAVSLNSLYRPDIVRWRERLKERYKKPEFGKYLLLIPCSARKPYSESNSHRAMRRATKSTMHEVILTSPLGLVPRELEVIYPAKNYDIPVIGHWYEEEKKMIRDMLSWYLEKFEYNGIISYLPESMKFLEDILNEYGANMIWDMNLEKLEKETKKLNYHVPWHRIMKDNFSSLARFQFSCCDDFSDVKIYGRYPRVDFKKGKERYFGFDIKRGMLTLAEQSARELAEEGKYVVEIDDFYPEGDVFSVGILNANSEIREGDEVAIVHGGELRAWGIARMNSYDMINEKKGKAVKVRDRIHQ